jgi:hypothetical protein
LVEWRLAAETKVLGEKPAPAPLLSITKSHMTRPGFEPGPPRWDQRLTSWAMARPEITMLSVYIYPTQSTFKYVNKFLWFVYIRILGGGGVQLDSLGTSVTNWPTVPAPVDYEGREFGGMMIGRETRSILRKPAPVLLCPQQIPHVPTGREPGPSRWEASD